MTVGAGSIDVVGEVPKPVEITVRRPASMPSWGPSSQRRTSLGCSAHWASTRTPDSGATGRSSSPSRRSVRISDPPDGRGGHRRGGGPHLRLRPDHAPHAQLAAARQAHRLPTGSTVAEGRGVRLGCSEAWSTTTFGVRARPGRSPDSSLLYRGDQPAGRVGALLAILHGAEASSGRWCTTPSVARDRCGCSKWGRCSSIQARPDPLWPGVHLPMRGSGSVRSSPMRVTTPGLPSLPGGPSPMPSALTSGHLGDGGPRRPRREGTPSFPGRRG